MAASATLHITRTRMSLLLLLLLLLPSTLAVTWTPGHQQRRAGGSYSDAELAFIAGLEKVHVDHSRRLSVVPGADGRGQKSVSDSGSGSKGRRLATSTGQWSTDGAISDPPSNTHPIRMVFNTALIDGAAAAPTNVPYENHCTAVGQTVDGCLAGNLGSSCPMTCTEADVVTPRKVQVLKERLGWMRTKLASTLRVKLMTPDAVSIGPVSKQNYGLADTTSPGTDLVIVLTMHPGAVRDMVAYAFCVDREPEAAAQAATPGRCMVGYFNWCPDQLDTQLNTKDLVMANRHTALHEVMHIVGCCNPKQGVVLSDGTIRKGPTKAEDSTAAGRDNRVFVVEPNNRHCTSVDPTTGRCQGGATEDYAGGLTKLVVKITSPKVLDVARKQFDCPTLRGMPLEDMALGAFAHWEARLMGPAVMSYGTGAGETYLSDMTLAFIHDSGRYWVNFSAGGRLVEPTANDLPTATSVFAKMSNKEDVDIVPYSVPTPGYLTYGRWGGCGFVLGSPSADPAWERYRCETLGKHGCTVDNRMSATCGVIDWDQQTGGVYRKASCRRSKKDSDCTINAAWKQGILPVDQQYFSGSASKGGYIPAMDYVPTQIGYWSCLDAGPATVSHAAFDYGDNTTAAQSDADWDKLFASLKEVKTHGGQFRSVDSRCFTSSLRRLTEGSFDKDFVDKGLCYLSNCYSTTYLQFALKTSRGQAKWYGCPKDSDGTKKFYIPGYAGSIVCPDVVSFCRQEAITGKFYGETDATAEWIIFGVVAGIPFLLACAMLLCPGFRRRFLKKTAQCCGLRLKFGELDSSEHYLALKFKAKNAPRSCSGRFLVYINAFWLLGATGCVVLGGLLANGQIDLWGGSSRQAPLFFMFGFFVGTVSLLGFMAGRRDHPTLRLLVYYYICLWSLLGMVGLFCLSRVATESVKQEMQLHYDFYKKYMPNSWQKLSMQAAIDKFFARVTQTYIVPLAVFAGIGAASLSGGIIAAGNVLQLANIVSNFLIVMNALGAMIGLFWVVAGATTYASLPPEIMGMIVGPGLLILLISILGFCGAQRGLAKGHGTLLKLYGVLAILVELVTLSCGLASVLMAGTIGAKIEDMSPEQFSELAKGLARGGYTMTKDQVKAYCKNNTALIGGLLLIFSFVLLLLIICAFTIARVYKVEAALKAAYTRAKEAVEAKGKLYMAEHPNMTFSELYHFKLNKDGTASLPDEVALQLQSRRRAGQRASISVTQNPMLAEQLAAQASAAAAAAQAQHAAKAEAAAQAQAAAQQQKKKRRGLSAAREGRLTIENLEAFYKAHATSTQMQLLFDENKDGIVDAGEISRGLSKMLNMYGTNALVRGLCNKYGAVPPLLPPAMEEGRLTPSSLRAFYTKFNAPPQVVANVERILWTFGTDALVQQLRAKYGEGPQLVVRITAQHAVVIPEDDSDI